MKIDYLQFADRVKISPELAKKIIDILDKKDIDVKDMNSVLFRLEREICNEALKNKLNKSTDKQIKEIIDDMINDRCRVHECLSEIELVEWKDILDEEFELLTTAKQTDPRYGNFEFSKKDLQEMATNFNNDVVGTEIPVDLNHDPEHIAYAWIEPWSMRVTESTKLKWKFSLFAKLYRFTPEWEDMITTGKIRYFSLQIQHKFEKIVDEWKKIFKNVIRALAFTNMPVIKDMSPTFNEPGNNLSDNHNDIMEKQELELKLSEANIKLNEIELANKIDLAEKDAKNKELSEKIEKQESEKHEVFLSEGIKELSLSEDNKIGFKGGEMDKISEFVKTLSADQAKEYFTIHKDIITSANFSEKGETGKDEGKDNEEANNNKAIKMAEEMAKDDKITFSEAIGIVLGQNPELAKDVY